MAETHQQAARLDSQRAGRQQHPGRSRPPRGAAHLAERPTVTRREAHHQPGRVSRVPDWLQRHAGRHRLWHRQRRSVSQEQ